MADSPLEAYLATQEERVGPIVRALAAAVEAAGAGLDSKVSYRMLMYTLGGRYRDWVVAIGTSTKLVHLRFLHGDRMADTAGILRAGSSTLRTIDYASLDQVDPQLVTAYVREAVAVHGGAG